MKKSFFEIQAAETWKIAIVAAVIFAVYFGVFFALTLGVMVLFEGSGAGVLVRALIWSLVLAVAVLGIQLWYADRYGVKVILDGLSAKGPDPEDRYHQRLTRIVEELGVSAGGIRARPMVVPTLACNAFALADSRQAVVGVTEGVVSRLTRAQTQAVVAHEMAHIANRDCRLATWVCAMAAPFLALAESLEKLDETAPSAETWAGSRQDRAANDSAAGMAVAIRGTVDLLTVALSRKREMRADAKAVELTRNPLAMAEAIYRVANADHYVGGPAESLSPIFILPSRVRPVDQRESALADLLSSHPPTHKRLDMLVVMAHTSLDAVSQCLETRPQAAPGASLDERMAATEKWMLRTGSAWSGPFALAELARQTDFGPQSWVRRESERTEGMPAFNDPLLTRFFRHGQKTLETTSGTCPRCAATLAKTTYEGVPVGRCPDCHGVLVDKDRVRRLLGRREVAFSDTFLAEVQAWYEKHRVAPDKSPWKTAPDDAVCTCPSCQKPMMRRPYNYQYFIPIDLCLTCRQMWFDHKELETLQALIEHYHEMRAGRYRAHTTTATD